MFTRLSKAEPDPILAVAAAYRADPRPDKVDLGVGVYKDEQGRTPIMRAVKAAETRLLAEQDTKTYTQLLGEPDFRRALAQLVFGGSLSPQALASAATCGGTGAVRMALEVSKAANPNARLWISEPTWPNHLTIAAAVSLEVKRYRWVDRETGGLDREGLFADLSASQAGDLLLLHGCCHNPTGIDPTPQDWEALAQLCVERGLIPLVDLAYQGFGDGLEGDALGIRLLIGKLPRVLVAVSGAKNFGLYRERVGACFVHAPEEERAAIEGTLAAINRVTISFPPDHGARVVTLVLTDPDLRRAWEEELSAMRTRLNGLRTGLAEALRAETGSDRFAALATQKGMFSVLPLSPAAVATLAREHAIYAVPGGRINVAGLTEAAIPRVARAFATVLRS